MNGESGVDTERCFVCGARASRPEAGKRRVCLHCGLRFRPNLRRRMEQARLAAMIRSGHVDLRRNSADWTMDIYTLRIAASVLGRAVIPANAAQAGALAHPHSELPAVAATPPLACFPKASLTIGLLARPSDGPQIARLIADYARFGLPIIVALDGESVPPEFRTGPISKANVLAAPLAGDFARQRDRLQQAAATEWVLQQDADEIFDPGGLDTLRRFASAVGAQGIRSIGLRRINLVDGRRSDLWPDVQYRLNRREIRFRGRVHERPDLGGKWRHSTISLQEPLVHRLCGDRVVARSGLYEAMQRGGSRLADQMALLRAYAP